MQPSGLVWPYTYKNDDVTTNTDVLFLCLALESKLVSKFCEDENGALIYNSIANGYGTNGHATNGHATNGNGQNGYNIHGNSGQDSNYKYEVEVVERNPVIAPDSYGRGRGDSFSLPINAGPAPAKVHNTSSLQQSDRRQS